MSELSEGKMEGTPSPENISTKLRKVATLAREAPKLSFTALAHHIDLEWMKEAYRRTRKKGAVGVDGQTAEEYAANLEVNLQSLLDRMKSGTYRAPPVRRVHIPKGNGSETRPIGIPTFEDKVLQRAVAMLLEAIYEQDFLGCSYGFRPGRSAHQALESLWKTLMDRQGAWVIEIDVRKFFDTLDHEQLREILSRRVRDGVLVKLIGKWLRAGVMESGELSYPDAGTPQGGVISPLLANIYLHDVMDRWMHEVVQPRLRAKAAVVRYADDLVVVCRTESDARKIMDVLPKRFARYGLTLHPTKTKLLSFYPSTGKVSFDFLGFRHFWTHSRNGKWVVRRKTATDRFGRALKNTVLWCKENRHRSLYEQWKMLSQKLRGHYAYYGISGNSEALQQMREQVVLGWRKWLMRRSYASRKNWDWFNDVIRRYVLPRGRVRSPGIA